MMKRIDIEKIGKGSFDHYFEGDGYGTEKDLKEWIKALADSKEWEAKSGNVKESDDFDAPEDTSHEYESLDALKAAIKSEIPEMAVEGFYIMGNSGGTDIAVSANIFGPKNISVLAPEDFDSEGFLKKIGIE